MGRGFLSSLLHREYSPIGLDVGHDSIKMLQLRRMGGAACPWQVAAGGIHIFTEEERQNSALRWRHVASGIQSILSGGGRASFGGRRIVAALGHDQVLLKNARLPKMPPEELAQAVRWEAAERFPFDVDSGQLRYLLAGDVRQGGEQRQEVLMFAIDDQVLRETLGVLEQAGCHPVGLDARPLALARAAGLFMPADGDPDTVHALADVGSHGCQLLICRGGRVVFVKTVEIGSQDLTRAIVDKVGTSPEDTIALRMRLGGGSGESADDESQVLRAVTAATRPVIDRLAQEIVLCLRYYSVTFRGDRPDCVTLVGGAAHDHLFGRLLSESLGMKVDVGRPLAMCQPTGDVCQWGLGVESGGPEWAVALGCCLKPMVKASGSGISGPADGEESADAAAGRQMETATT